ncbi:archaellin/type IV pilin N-terminal domain-containing protein [Natrinema halophilum]|uniref:Flagellin n=1 Tax=Natrinema halophilum TaxID=1699371 RepID=A0A7D5KD99_9EURY|nr:archaellin/type IV pilin N-terminal domain-containing protein [Natrinema halophilum]QLG49261.1 flagellin [Natrinema halophilum]
MSEATIDSEERGQVGIGTLIVFIAMVLVAAIAAGVLINTAGVLQSQASDTGSETQQAVANQIEVVHASGNITQDGDYVDRLNLTIKKSAGSQAIDVSSMTVQYTSDSVDRTLTYRGSDTTYQEATDADISTNASGAEAELDHYVGGYTASAGDYTDFDSISDPTQMGLYAADSDHFTTFAVNNGKAFLTDNEERITLTINTTVIEDPNGLDDGLKGGEGATIKLIDLSGAQFSYGVEVPSTFGNKQVVEV